MDFFSTKKIILKSSLFQVVKFIIITILFVFTFTGFKYIKSDKDLDTVGLADYLDSECLDLFPCCIDINPTNSTIGSIQITSVSTGESYEYNTTGFNNLPLAYSSATNTIGSLPHTVIDNIPPNDRPTNDCLRVYESNDFEDSTIVLKNLRSNFPQAYSCDNTTLLVGDLLPNGDGQTVSFPFGNGTTAPPACTEKLNYGGEGLAYCENSNVVYIARFAPNEIVVWDLASNSLSTSIPLTTGSPYDMAMTLDCSYLYVATTTGLERIDLSTNTIDQSRSSTDLSAVTAVSGEPWGIDIHPITGEVYTTFGWGSWWPAYGGGPREGSVLKLAADLQGTITEIISQEVDGLFMGLKFLPNGNFWITWDGEEPPTFPFPYVHSEEIRLYDDMGNLLQNEPIIIGGSQEYFIDPNDIAFGPDGNIYVTSYAKYCVVRYMTATDTWEEYLGADPSGATGKNLEFVCSNVFCVEICNNGIDDDGDGLVDCDDCGGCDNNSAPVFTVGSIPSDITIQCTDPIPSAPSLSATDNCGTPTITFSEDDNQSADVCNQHNYQIIRRWTATDNCGNTTKTSQTITVEDPTNTCSGAGVIGGTAFLDANNNGLLDDGLDGLAGIEVYLFEESGGSSVLLAQTTTDSYGNYSFDTGLVSGNSYKVEFVRPIGMIEEFTRHGDDNGTNVQFVTAPNCDVHVGLANPNDYCQSQPYMYVSCYSFGASENNPVDAIVGLPLNLSSDANENGVIGGAVKHLANAEHVGSTYGLAYSETKDMLYAAAFMKRHAGFGPGGTGAIYQIDPNGTSPDASVLVDLNALFGANTAGADPHPYGNTEVCPGCLTSSGTPDNFNCWNYDTLAWDAVGRISLGDIDVSDDGEELFVMNLADKNLYRIDIDNPAATTRYAFPEGDISCASGGEVRPFAVEFKNNKVYVGAICDQITWEVAMLYVYELDLTTSTWRRVLEANYQRSDGNPANGVFFSWIPFNTWGSGSPTYRNGSHPVLSSLSFDNDAMVLGIRDLSGDKQGHLAGRPDRACSLGKLPAYQSNGDIFRAGYNSSTNQYEMESNATVNGITTAGLNSGYGLGSGFGTTGSSYYFEDIAPNGATQISLGGLVQLPGGALYTSAYDVMDLYDFGIAAYDNETGTRAQTYQLAANTNDLSGFGKANGLGDLEFGCEGAPVEIGNRVWFDSNENGIQDVSENGIPNVSVLLYNVQGELVSTQTTDSDGEYYFSDLTMGDSTLRPNDTYYIVIQGPNYDSANQVLMDSFVLTNANIGQAPSFDINDSDGTIGTSSNPNWVLNYPFIEVNTGSFGVSNHDSDFGFIRCIPEAQSTILNTCDNSNGAGSGTFNLDDADSMVSIESGVVISYHSTLADAESGANDLVSPYNSSDVTVYVRVERISNGCSNTASITLDVGPSCIEVCNNGIDDDGDGLTDCFDCEDCFDSSDCDDYDSDGVGDFCDLDDDNDGIPDEIEGCVQHSEITFDRAFPSQNINGDLDVSFTSSLGLTGRILTAFASGGSVPTHPIYEDPITGLGITSRGGSATTTGAHTSITFDTKVTIDEFIVTSVAKDYSGSYDESQQIRFYSEGVQVELTPIISGTNSNPNVYATYNSSTGLALGEDPTVGGTGGEAAFTFTINRVIDSIVVMQNRGAVADNIGIRFFGICSERDTDNDGIPDQFDLDSDGDSCPDAIEGDASFDSSDLVGSSISGGNSGAGYTGPVIQSVTGNLGNTIEIDLSSSNVGIPIVAGGGQGKGSSQDASISSCPEICNDGIDNDGDGQIDSDDTDCCAARAPILSKQ